MATPAEDESSSNELMQYAFHMEPQYEHSGELWTAHYPEADWSVSAPTKEEAHKRLGEEFIRRQNSGQDPLAYADAVFRRHLQAPVPGVYAVDNELYRVLVHEPEVDRKRALHEAERRRRLGQTYTKADYEARAHG